ncbi:CCDC135 family protein [Megaselia abdita]
MATLLCSMLIGSGFPAVVISGVARRHVILNDQTQCKCPIDVSEEEESLDDSPGAIDNSKYLLRPIPDLRSHLDEHIAVLQKKKDEYEKNILEREEKARLDHLDIHTKDRYKYRRYHAWVAIIENAPWTLKEMKKYTNEDGKEINEPMSAFFIEPSTGFRHEVTSNQYLLVESMWNHENYFVNKQCCEIKNIDWDVTNKENWESFLPAEPVKLRNTGTESEENLEEQNKIWIEKHLDTLRSWVEKLHISDHDFENRFPNFQKIIKYNKCIHIRYSPYSQMDGKINQITYYDDSSYETPTVRWIWYEQRTDFLEKIKILFITEEIKEFFSRGRKDCLKNYYHSNNQKKPKILNFFNSSRNDSLKQMRIYSRSLCLIFKDACDLCSYQEFRMKSKGRDLEAIIEKFNRNILKLADDDIAIRHFALTENKIYLTFHYNEGAVTASSREFTKPPKSAYGKEIIFDPSTTKGYMANADLDEPTQLQLYVLLLQQLKREEKVKKMCDIRFRDYHDIIDNRKDEMTTPKLKFSMFDKLRNQGARNIRIKKFEEEEARKLEVMKNDADFLAPYLVFYTELPPPTEQSLAAYNACLNDLKDRYVRLLNELQRKYEDLTHERNALNRFLLKFETQFDNFDYERLVQEAKDIQLNQRMVQQRLTTTHEEAQKKFEKVKEFLLKDSRLNLPV